MEKLKDDSKPPIVTINESGLSNSQDVDIDTQRLADMGYTQDMRRKFSVWSVLGVAFSLTGTWTGVSGGLITGINSGGPALLIYGTILLFIVSMAVAVSLSELISAMPNAAGQAYWTRQLAPKKYASVLSFVTGWFAWSGSIFGSASAVLALAYAVVGCYQLSHPGFTIQPWNVFVAYQACNIFCFFFNCYGRALPYIATTCLYASLIGFVIVFITVPAGATTYQDARFVFETFINNTGWDSNGVAFLVGLVNVNWGFSCLDTAVHMAEEIHQPERLIPFAVIGTVAIGFLTSFPFLIAMLFSLRNFEAVADTATWVPILELFFQALGNRAGAIALEVAIIFPTAGCLIACHTWQSRLCWSFARDRGLPFNRWLSKVHPVLDVPLNAHLFGSCLIAMVGCLYLASSTAYASIVAACIVLPYISYAIPLVCLLIRGRTSIRPGPFWLGRVGLACNIVTLLWIMFTATIYALPSRMPVDAGSMNYIPAVYGCVIGLTCLDWTVRGNKSFQRA